MGGQGAHVHVPERKEQQEIRLDAGYRPTFERDLREHLRKSYGVRSEQLGRELNYRIYRTEGNNVRTDVTLSNGSIISIPGETLELINRIRFTVPETNTGPTRSTRASIVIPQTTKQEESGGWQASNETTIEIATANLNGELVAAPKQTRQIAEREITEAKGILQNRTIARMKPQAVECCNTLQQYLPPDFKKREQFNSATTLFVTHQMTSSDYARQLTILFRPYYTDASTLDTAVAQFVERASLFRERNNEFAQEFITWCHDTATAIRNNDIAKIINLVEQVSEELANRIRTNVSRIASRLGMPLAVAEQIKLNRKAGIVLYSSTKPPEESKKEWEEKKGYLEIIGRNKRKSQNLDDSIFARILQDESLRREASVKVTDELIARIIASLPVSTLRTIAESR